MTNQPQATQPPGLCPGCTISEKLIQRKPKLTEHLSITLGLPVIILFDLVVPCIIYYVWYNIHKSRWERDCQAFATSPGGCPLEKPETDKHILGYSIVCFGIGELYILIARVYRLLAEPNECAPLLSRSRWELDATSWVFGVSLICALIPFVVSSSFEIPKLFLYSPTFLLGFLAVLMVITFIPIPTPIGIDSQPAGTRLRPFVYYAAEDFLAVDCLQNREFRLRYNRRYESSRAFRRMLLYLTVWWFFGVCVYVGAVSAVIWTLPFHVAFGLSFGVLFAFIFIWAVISYVWVRLETQREARHTAPCIVHGSISP